MGITPKIVELNEVSAGHLEDRIQAKIKQIAAVADEFPGVLIVHNLQKDASVEYISKLGLIKLGLTLEDIRKMGKTYHEKFFNPADVQDYFPKLNSFIERNDKQEIISFFQQVRASEKHDWTWHLSTIKILMQDDDGKPLLTITMSWPIDPLHHITHKVSRLLDENTFLRRNFHNFSKLSKREREILKLLVLGKTSVEIAKHLNIAVSTAETHRRNIKDKLNADTTYELTQYASAFDLI